MASTHKHYYPILKSKQGEMWALRKLKSKSKKMLTPIFEIPPVPTKKGSPTKTLTQHLTDAVTRIVSSWGTEPCFIDTRWLYNLHGDTATTAVFDEARNQKLLAIPVIQATSVNLTLTEVAKIVKKHRHGAMLRAKRPDLHHPVVIQQAITALGIGPGDIDFLLDYRSQSMSLPTDVPEIAKVHPLNSWRNLIAASGVFPSSVASCNDGAWHAPKRTCWTTWRVGSKKLDRIPSFADYLVRDPGAPATGGNPPVTLRYTTDDEWLVRVSGSLQTGDAPRMHGLCAELIVMAQYAGPSFSSGDQEIENTATYVNPTPGGAQQWLQWAENHHLEHVLNQLTSI